MSLTLHIMACGWITLPTAFLITGGEGTTQIPVPTYLIRHPNGFAVMDTGLEPGLGIEEATTLGGRTLHDDLERASAAPVLRAGEDIAARLRAAEVDPERVDYIVSSHLHFDHCGGNSLLPNARLVVQKREWAAACSPECQAAHHYFPHEYELGHDRVEVDGEHDLFGDGSVVCIPTFGHTPGHQSLRVKLDDGDVLLTADACYLRRSMEEMVLPTPEVVGDPEQMLENFRYFANMQRQGMALLFGHDRDQFDQLSNGDARQVAARTVAATRLATGASR